jgi:GNAT superfamily N-acetyltransferase
MTAAPAIRLRPLQGADAAHWQAFEALLRRYAATDLDQPQHSSIGADLARLPARYGAAAGGGVVLAWAGDAPVGCGAFAATRAPGLCEIKRLYLLPDWRGRGLGRPLVQAVLQAAHAAGYARAALSTWPGNAAGLALYGALGFAPVPPFKNHPNPALLYLGRALPAFTHTA